MQFTSLSKKNRKVLQSKLASRLTMESLESRVLLDGALPAAARGLLVSEPPGQLELQRLDAEATLSGIDTLTALPGAPQAAHQVIVQLTRPPLAQSGAADGAAQQQHVRQIQEEQAEFLGRHPTAKVLGQTQRVLNAVFLDVEATALAAIDQDPWVTRMVPVADYQVDLSETVPYIGATAVQDLGYDGSGVTVAVLDSGIDYTHANLGGPGTLEAYEAAYGAGPSDPANTTRDGFFPTGKVVEGYDFVGEAWPEGPLAPDDDPIDFDGHGTHVADIIGGTGGVAPGVNLLAVKVCSAVSSRCSGVALIQGMEYAVDPNGDGMTDDRVDVINMSLGSDYGQPFDDDLSLAVDNATAFGVLTVASAGNGSDKPYIVGTPSAARTALSVAQTQVPSATLPLIDVDDVGPIASVFQPWSSEPAAVISAPVTYGNGAGGNLDGCNEFAGGALAGQIVLVDRGGCFFTTKIFNIQNAGGAAGIIGLVAPGEPFQGGYSDPGGPITIPGYMISQADASAIKGALPTGATIDPAIALPLVGQMVGSSSRGPGNFDNRLKPEIGAPGASVSAQVGTGTGTTPFGGTSGAAPMVAGSAALILDAYANAGMEPALVKSLLMNSAERDIQTDPFSGPAPISRIGAGEVRVDRALEAPAAAWNDETGQATLGFGMLDVADEIVTIIKKVRVRNLTDVQADGGDPRTLRLSAQSSFRFANDQLNGAVSIEVNRQQVNLNAGQDHVFTVKLQIDGSKLRGNYMNSGSQGANPDGLTLNEYDGYIVIHYDDGQIHLPWHVLPRKAARTLPTRTQLNFKNGIDVIGLNNTGVGEAQTDTFSLIAVSPDKPRGEEGQQMPMPDIRAVGVNTFPVPANFCSAEPSFVWTFAVNTWERQTHLLPVSHQVWLDTNQDGASDYVVLNRDVSFSGGDDGRQLSWAVDLATGDASAFFFAEHAMNTGNTVMYVCGEQVGLSAGDLLTTNVDAFVIAQDFYFGGPGDRVDGLTVTPLGERYLGIARDISANTVDRNGLAVYDFGTFPGNSPDLGLMTITNGDRGPGLHGGATAETEAIFFAPRDVDLKSVGISNASDLSAGQVVARILAEESIPQRPVGRPVADSPTVAATVDLTGKPSPVQLNPEAVSQVMGSDDAWGESHGASDEPDDGAKTLAIVDSTFERFEAFLP